VSARIGKPEGKSAEDRLREPKSKSAEKQGKPERSKAAGHGNPEGKSKNAAASPKAKTACEMFQSRNPSRPGTPHGIGS
jgi:hypothetical protein